MFNGQIVLMNLGHRRVLGSVVDTLGGGPLNAALLVVVLMYGKLF
jgi:hypothetical protein